MSINMYVHDELISANCRNHDKGHAVLELKFQPKTYDGGAAVENDILVFFNDATLANRLQLDIAYRLKERRDELAREPMAEAAE